MAVAGISRRLWRCGIERDEWRGKKGGGSKAIIGGLNLHQSHRKWQSLSPDLLRRPWTTLGTKGTAVASAPAPMPSSSPLSLTLILRTYAASLNKLSSSSPDSTRRTTYRLFLSFSTSLIHFFLRDKKILRRRFTSFLVRCALFVPSVSMMACRTTCAVLAPALPPSRSLSAHKEGKVRACMNCLSMPVMHMGDQSS